MGLIKINNTEIKTDGKDVLQVFIEAFKDTNLNINNIVSLEEKLSKQICFATKE